MKTSKKISTINKQNRLLLILSVIPILIFLFSILFHVTPLRLLAIASDFAVHHYFISGFLAIVTFLIIMRTFLNNKKKITDIHNEKILASQLKSRNRRARLQKFKNNISIKLLALKNRFKKDVLNIKYSENDVLSSLEEIHIRQSDLLNGMKLGNTFKQSVKLHYKESNLNKCIESAILFVSNEHVTLKGGYVLPIKSIYKVEL
jgi:uncharacterized membrane protein